MAKKVDRIAVDVRYGLVLKESLPEAKAKRKRRIR